MTDDEFRHADLVPDFLCLCRGDRIVHLNPAGARMLGLDDPAEAAGRRLVDFLHGDYVAVLGEGLDLLSGEDAVPMIFLRRDQRPVEAEVRVREWPAGRGNEPLWAIYARNVSAQLRAVKEVMASEERYRRLIDLVRDFICTTEDGRVTMINAAGLRMLEYGSRNDVVGRRLADMVHPDYLPVIDLGLPVLADETTQLPLKFMTRNGNPVDVEVRVIALGRDNAFMIEAHDIRRRLRSAEALREREARLHGILDAVADAIFTVDEHGIIQSFNKSAERTFGYRAEDVIGRTISMILAGRSPEEHIAEFKALLARGSAEVTMELIGRRSDGGTMPVEMNLSDLWLGRSRLFTGALRDITDRKLAQEVERRYKEELEEKVEERTRDLRRLGLRTRRILDSAGDGIVGLGTNGIITFANPAAARMLGWPQDELKGQAARSVLRHADGPRRGRGIAVAAAMRRGVFFERTEAAMLRRDGTSFAAEYASSRIEEDGETSGAVVVFRDVTERKAAEERLRVAATVFESTTQGVLVCRPDGGVTMSNHAIGRILGKGQSEMQAASAQHLLFTAGPADWNEMIEALELLGHWDREYWTTSGEGRELALHVRAAAVRAADGSVGSIAFTVSDITERKRNEEKIRFQASYDMLTGLPNRTLFHDRLDHAIAVARRNGSGVALMFIDLDGFKAVNDTFGHEAGDLLLQEASERLRGCVRESDTVARLGGDEFTVIMADVVDEQPVRMLADRVLAALSVPFSVGASGQEGKVSGSIGIAMFPEHAASAQDLLRFADQAMYDAKDCGKTCFRFYRPEAVLSQ